MILKDRKAAVAALIGESAALCTALAGQADTIVRVADQIAEAFRRGNKVLLFGNGGSAADAEHIACELAGKFTLSRDPLPAVALTANTSSITAIANDFGYDQVFARQVRGLAAKGDVIIGISTSGISPNVIAGMKEAKRMKATTVALTGKAGKLRQISDHVIAVPSTNTPRIQEAHIVVGHIICYLVEVALFESKRLSDTSNSPRGASKDGR